MAVNLSMLQPGALKQVQLPDPTKKFKTIADMQAMQQESEMRGLQIKEKRGAIADQEKAHADAAKIVETLGKYGGDFEKALPELKAISPQFGFTVEKELTDRRATEAQIKQGEAATKQAEERLGFDRFKLGQESHFKQMQDIRDTAKEANSQELEWAKLRKPENQTADIQNYNLSVQQGYKGSFTDWLKEKANFGDAGGAESTVTIQTVDSQGNPVTRVIPKSQAVGRDFQAAPTAEQRNFQASIGKIDPVLTGISELSEKINVGKGIVAKASGAVEKAKAELNYNDDVAEYEALISGFTPMVARAVGHTGVLTQQDVDSVRAMFPKPGDSKTLRDRKITRIKGILGTLKENPVAPTTPSGEDAEFEFVPGKGLLPVKK